jgi:hypothetical protein
VDNGEMQFSVVSFVVFSLGCSATALKMQTAVISAKTAESIKINLKKMANPATKMVKMGQPAARLFQEAKDGQLEAEKSPAASPAQGQWPTVFADQRQEAIPLWAADHYSTPAILQLL